MSATTRSRRVPRVRLARKWHVPCSKILVCATAYFAARVIDGDHAMSNLLIVDDEPNVLSALRRLCQNSAIPPALPDPSVTTFTSPLAALAHVAKHKVDLVISDFRMPEMDGAVFLTRVKDVQPDAARIILSACTDMDGIIRAINHAGIFRFVSKPWSDHDLKASIIDVLEPRSC